jgi:hypothetical protein
MGFATVSQNKCDTSLYEILCLAYAQLIVSICLPRLLIGVVMSVNNAFALIRKLAVEFKNDDITH